MILDPQHGLLFVEVKAGTLRFEQDSHKWVRLVEGGRKESVKDPFYQVRQSMHTLMGMIKQHPVFARSGVPFTFGYAVAFPGCRCDGSLPPDIMPELIFDADRGKRMKKSLDEAFGKWGQSHHEPMTAIQIRAIHEVFYPKFGITPVIWKRVEDQEKKLKRMTKDQEKTLKLLKHHKKALIRGVAGSGKTIFALAKAQEMAGKGLKTLFLCYNSQLKEWLESTAEKVDGNLVISTYHELVNEVVRKTGQTFRKQKDEDNDQFWNDRAPEALMEATAALDQENKFDAIVVDEGQDCRELWWMSLEGVFKDPNNKECFYIFYDPFQNIYVESPSLPGDMGEPYELEQNCRNTVKIAQHCETFVSGPIPVLENAPEGEEPQILKAKTQEEAFRLAERKVREWCLPNEGGLELRQVAVLSDGATRSQWPRKFGVFGTTENLSTWMSSKAILMESWARFKGLEADAIILIETDRTEGNKSRANRYVARSRAKHLLTIIEVDGV